MVKMNPLAFIMVQGAGWLAGNTGYIVGGVIAALLVLYLAYALIKPEKF
jgi:K+-transporting ATPase KdpF subunit